MTPPANDSPPPDFTSAERAAAEWVMRIRSGLTGGEQVEFARWIQRAPDHAALYAEMKATWQLLDGLHSDPRFPTQGAPGVFPTSAPKLAPRQRKPKFVRLRLGFGALAAAAMIALVWALWIVPRMTPFAYAHSATTQIGARQRLDLPDGSTVHVNTSSEVEIEFTVAERRVRLNRGEAFFQVASHRAWPFRVQAAGVSVRAVGTAFNVRYRNDSIEVLVSEGKVGVDSRAAERSAAPPRELGAAPTGFERRLVGRGEKAIIALGVDSHPPAEPVRVQPVPAPQLQTALAWQDGRLEFTDVPLQEMLAEFNRYNRHQLIVEDSQLAMQRFGGVFGSNRYDSLVEMLEQTFGVTAERGEAQTVLRKRRP
jgi:transmembrane sensor